MIPYCVLELEITICNCTVTNSFNCTTQSNSININACTVGISQPSSENSFVVYPNPTDEFLNIKGNEISNGRYELVLSSVFGQQIRRNSLQVSNHSFATKMSLKELASGIYFLSITSDKINIAFKIQKL